MTVQPVETGTSLDLELMVGEMPAVPCEHRQHRLPGYAHDDGPATHYVRGFCVACGDASDPYAVCQTYVNWVLSDGPMRCRSCHMRGVSSDLVTILGPVNG